MADVFISYAREDRERASELVAAFEDKGCTVFWDANIGPGSPFRRRLADEIELALRVVVLWSRQANRSNFVPDEATRAQDLGSLVSVTLDGEQPPDGFRGSETTDLANASSTDVEFQTFVDTVVSQLTAPRKAVVDAGLAVRSAFRSRIRGDFEHANDLFQDALHHFEDMLDGDAKMEYRTSDRYRDDTLGELGRIAVDPFGGSLMETLAAVSPLPVIDAVMTIDKKQVVDLLPTGCPLKPELQKVGRVRVGVVVRPGSGVNDDLLISRLKKETTDRGGALDLHCFLLVINSESTERAVQFSARAQESDLSASCVIWVPSDGSQLLQQRIIETAAKLCDGRSGE